MKLSVFYDHIIRAVEQTGRSLPDLLTACREFGIEGLEIKYGQLKEGGSELRLMIQEAGLAVSCTYEMYDFTHNDDLTSAKAHVDLAAEVGAKKVLIVPGFLEKREAGELWDCVSGQKSDTGDRAMGNQGDKDAGARKYEAVSRYMENSASICRVRDALRELVNYGREKGIKITLEDFDNITSPCSGMWFLKWFMEQVPGLGHAFDMGNYAYSDENAEEAFELLKPYIVHVHCKDRGAEPGFRISDQEKGIRKDAMSGEEVHYCRYCQGLASVPTGGGYLPIGRLVERLQALGYNDYLAIEHFGAADQFDYIRRSAEFLKEKLARQ